MSLPFKSLWYQNIIGIINRPSKYSYFQYVIRWIFADMFVACRWAGLDRKFEADRGEDPALNQRVEFQLTNRDALVITVYIAVL